MQPQPLAPYGWSDRWAALLADHPGCDPARVVRHDGSGLLLATTDGIVAAPLTRRLDPAPTVGDWIACEGDEPVAVLERSSLLTRRAAEGDFSQALAANVDLVLLVCGLDRPVKAGRLQRAATLAWDAGATPVVVLTKAQRSRETQAATDPVVRELHESSPGLEVLVTSAKEGVGLDPLRDLARDKTVTMLGESGAGKSSLLNALTGVKSAATAAVRERDSKGRHTTTTRELYLLPTGGALIDSPGIRSVGLWVDPDAVDATFDDIDELAAGCKFANCEHDTEPSCVVRDAVQAGTLSAARLEQWRALHREAEAAALRALPHEKRKREKKLARVTKEAQKRKGR
jgi:ribosome biogenesis GTPase / thiamine phosphate phosphatase